MSIGLGTAVGYLDLDASGFARGVDEATGSMNRLSSKFSTASQGLQAIGGTFTHVGSVLTASLTAPIAGFGAASIKAGTEFDSAMSQVSAVSKATGNDLATIRDRALEMGEKTRYSAKEVSDAMYYMGLAGWNAKEIYDGIPGVLALAASSGEDLARVSDIVTDSLTAFGKTADDTSEFVNVLAEASRSSNTTVDLLGESFKYVAPVAGAFGYSIQDVAVALGIFANNGVKGSQAGTGLRQALNSLINPSETAAGLMEKYGISLFNADGSTKSLMKVMEELRTTFGGLSVDIIDTNGEVMTGEEIMEKYGHSLPNTEMEKLTSIVKIFGVRALPGMLSVINASDESFDSLTKAIYGAQDAYNGLGTAFGMQETMMDNLQGDWYKFTSALGTTKIIISDMAKGALRDLLQTLTKLVQKFNDLEPEQREQIVKWALMVAAIGPALIAFGKVISGIGNMIQTFVSLKNAFGAVTNGIKNLTEGFKLAKAGFPGLGAEASKLGSALGGISSSVVIIIAVIAALVAAFATLWKTNEEFRNNIISIWEEIKGVFQDNFQKITEAINSLGFEFEDITEVMKAAWMGLCELLAPLFEGAFSLVGDILGWASSMVADFVQIITGIIKGFKDGDWSLLWEGIGGIVMDTVTYILNILDTLANTIWDLVQTVANWFGADWDMTWDEAKQAVSDWFDSVVNWFTEIPVKIGEFITFIKEFVQDIPTNVSNLLAEVWNNITTWFTNMLTKAEEFGSTFRDNVIKFFEELPGKVAEQLSLTFDKVSEWAQKMVNKAVEMGTNFLTAVVNFFIELPGKVWEFITDTLDNVATWATGMVDKALEMGANFLSSVVDFFVELPGNVLKFISETLQNVADWVSDMIDKAKEVGSKFLGGVVDFFKELPEKIGYNIGLAFGTVVKWVGDMKDKAIEVGTEFVANVVVFFKELPGKVSTFITDTFNKVKDWTTNMIDKAKKAGKDFVDSVVEFIKELPGKVWTWLTETLDKIGQWIKDLPAKGKEAIGKLIDGMKEGLSSLGDTIKNIGKNIVDGVWKGIKGAKDAFVDGVKGFFTSLVDGVKKGLGIASPSKVFADEVGYWIPLGASEGFIKAMPKATKQMQSSLDSGMDKLSADEMDLASEVMDFAEKFRKVFEGLVIWYETMEERLFHTIESMKDYLDYLVEVGKMVDKANNLGTTILVDNKKDKPETIDYDRSENPHDTGGDTFVFYSNEAIDEIKAARLLKETKRDLAEGFT